MMSLGKMFAGHDEDAEIIRKIKSIKVLDLESCTASVKERFNKKVNKLNLKGYDELMRVNDEGEKVRVLMKTKRKLSANCYSYAREKRIVHWYR